MNFQDRKNAFINLGQYLSHLSEREKAELFAGVQQRNPWFIPESTATALQGIISYLQAADMEKWLADYTFPENLPRKVGVVMAGNIPAVGFHDMLCVLLSGNILFAKLSSQDEVMMRFLMACLLEVEPALKNYIVIAERLNEVKALIATGSDNTSRYFEYYFRHVPHVLRKNRTAVAVLSGKESHEALQRLGKDIFLYFGLGCRNVSKLYVPEGYDFTHFFEAIKSFSNLVQHNKYLNNYEYKKAVFLLNQMPHFDNGFVLLQENENLVSPIAVLYFSYYQQLADVEQLLLANQEKIQCIVSEDELIKNSFAFGQAQQPRVWDYADGVDTLQFLSQLSVD
ncbi:MAG: acyl-CoA reductase [Verrucomicrobia bacterium]|nr:acyl-CoA reductase [Cytophagales bacterium]